MIELSSTARTILESRYLLRDAHDAVVETAEQMFRRVARTVAAVERERAREAEDAFHAVMSRGELLPSSPTLMNAGARLGQLMACFVLPIEDSLHGIFSTLEHAAQIWQTGGGTGFGFSRLRPDGDRVGSTGGEASGPVSFLEMYDAAADVMRRGGLRRAANMAVLAATHPDVLAFVRAKTGARSLPSFNLSVGVSDEVVAAAKSGRAIGLVNPRTGAVVRRIPAAEIFDEAARCAWESGDPGMLFLDRIGRDDPTPQLGGLEATNPCGEQPLLPYEACCLASVDVARFVVVRAGRATVDEERLARVVRVGVRFLDDVVDATRYPLPQIERVCRGNRKIGLGVMGFADLLVLLGVAYDSDEALDVADRLMALVRRAADEASSALAIERGPFPNFCGSALDRPGAPPLRNATRTTVAPTGTISIIAGCSSGIEPLFAVAYTRHILDRSFEEVHPLYREIVGREGPERARRLFVTAHEVSPEWHVRMQAAFQRHVDNAVSKTVNVPSDARPEDVRSVFLLAHELGCKGITVYRQGSKELEALSANPSCGSCAEDGAVSETSLQPRRTSS